MKSHSSMPTRSGSTAISRRPVLEPIRVGDPAEVKLMGYRQIVRGHVDSIARGINVANAQPNGQGSASVNPIFTWVRLAQRIPVRIRIDEVPEGVVLAAGMTATVQIDPQQRTPANKRCAEAVLRYSTRLPAPWFEY
jgi:multidrug resistance efflux pump